MTERKLKRQIILYLIDQILIVAAILGIIVYLSHQQISLIAPIAHEFLQFFYFSLIIFICSIAFVVNAVMIVKQIKGLKMQTIAKTMHPLLSYAVQTALILFVLFALLMTIAYSSGTGNPNYKKFNSSSNVRFSELDNEGYDIGIDFDYQTNPFGKVIDLEKINFVEDEHMDEDGFDEDINYCFYYRESNLSFIYDRFEKYTDDDLELDSYDQPVEVIKNDQYSLYIDDKDDDFTSYTLVIENETEYCVSEFWRSGEITKSDYSVDDFIKDSLDNYHAALE